MKRIAVYILALLVIASLYVGCSNNSESHEAMKLPIITLKNTGEEINPRFYEEGFDFNYDNLPTLKLAGNEDVLQIVLNGDFPSKVVIGEDYYKYTKNTGTVYQETHELDQDSNNIVLLPISRRGNVKDEQAIYYIVKGKTRFVFRVILPIDTVSPIV